MEPNASESVALLILRLGLGIFLLMWGLDKFFETEGAVGIFQNFYGLTFSGFTVIIAGIIEIIIAVLILLGVFKTVIYAIGLLMHLASMIVSYEHWLIHPFTGVNHLFIASIPVLGAFIALWLMRERDVITLQRG
jgi:uncharacterized membrane protein YphA (DoxX/SURF4 family)